MRLTIGVVALAGILALYGSRINGQEQTLSDGDALTLIRAVNTAEIKSILQSKHASDLASLRGHGFVQRIQSQVGLNWGASSDLLSAKGYYIRLAMTNDGLNYTLTLIPASTTAEAKCLPVYLGVIFKGSEFNCTVSGLKQ